MALFWSLIQVVVPAVCVSMFLALKLMHYQKVMFFVCDHSIEGQESLSPHPPHSLTSIPTDGPKKQNKTKRVSLTGILAIV
jgi:hypothetical protein